MKKSGIALLCLVLVLFMLLLTSCSKMGKSSAGDTPTDTATALRIVQTGTHGVETSFAQNYPPPLVYDQNELIIIADVHNKGNFDVNAQDCFVQLTNFDPNIIPGINTVRSCAESMNLLEGKNVYNLEGGYNQLEFRSSGVRLPDGVFEYNPTLNLVTCSKYQTRASPLVCVDPLFYQIASQQKSCTPQSVVYGTGKNTVGGQGGPVGVSSVGVNMIGGGSSGASKAVFEINVRNYNSAARVLSPDSELRNCGGASLSYTDFDKVRYEVRLSGGSSGNCKPADGLVRLTNGQGKIVCTFNIHGTTAYETPLQVTLDYNYIQSQQKAVKIIKTPQ